MLFTAVKVLYNSARLIRRSISEVTVLCGPSETQYLTRPEVSARHHTHTHTHTQGCFTSSSAASQYLQHAVNLRIQLSLDDRDTFTTGTGRQIEQQDRSVNSRTLGTLGTLGTDLIYQRIQCKLSARSAFHVHSSEISLHLLPSPFFSSDLSLTLNMASSYRCDCVPL